MAVTLSSIVCSILFITHVSPLIVPVLLSHFGSAIDTMKIVVCLQFRE